MAKLSILAGATSQSVNVFIQDSSVTTGAGLAGLVYNTSSLTAYYTFVGTNTAATAITLATLAAANSAYSSGGFKEIDATNMPGLYRLDIPNAALAASSGRSVVIMLKGAANMAPCVLEIELTAWNNQDGVRGGLTALPNAAAEAAGGLYTRGTGAGQINQSANGQVDINVARWLNTAVSTPTAAGVPNVNVKTWNDLATVALPLVPTTAGRTLDVSAGGEAGVDWANVGSQSTSVNLSATTTNLVNTITTYTGNTVQTGDSFARIDVAGVGLTNLGDARIANLDAAITTRMATYAQPTGFLAATFPGTVASPTNITAGTITTVTNLTNAPTAGDFTATMKTSLNSSTPSSNSDITAIKAKTDSLTFTVAGQVDANAESMNGTTILGNGSAGNLWRG